MGNLGEANSEEIDRNMWAPEDKQEQEEVTALDMFSVIVILQHTMYTLCKMPTLLHA